MTSSFSHPRGGSRPLTTLRVPRSLRDSLLPFEVVARTSCILSVAIALLALSSHLASRGWIISPFGTRRQPRLSRPSSSSFAFRVVFSAATRALSIASAASAASFSWQSLAAFFFNASFFFLPFARGGFRRPGILEVIRGVVSSCGLELIPYGWASLRALGVLSFPSRVLDGLEHRRHF